MRNPRIMHKPKGQLTRHCGHRRQSVNTTMMLRCAATILVLCAVAACHKAERCPSLENLKLADPVADATSAQAHGDHRLLMLGGFVGTIPGAEGSPQPTRLIEGTSDTETKAC